MFVLQVAVVATSEHSRELLVLTTFQGALVKFDTLVIQEISSSGVADVLWTEKTGVDCQILLELQGVASPVLSFHATYTSDDSTRYTQSTLVTFGV